MIAKRILWCFFACLLLPGANALLIGQSNTGKEITVFAAASLHEAFQTLGKNFEGTHSATKIEFNFGGSQQLVQQMVHGAKADLFASADMKQMRIATAAGLIDTSFIKIFVRNKLVVLLPKDNPANLTSLQDLANKNIKIILADSSVPVGRYSLQFLDRCSKSDEFRSSFKQAVLHNIVSYEENVRAVLNKVRLGECDAGIVYTSDIAQDTLHQVKHIEIPDPLNIIAEYPLAIVKESTSRHVAEEFLNYILSAEGGDVLSKFGFIPVISSDKK